MKSTFFVFIVTFLTMTTFARADVVVDTKGLCVVGTVTMGLAPMGDFHYLDVRPFEFKSRQTVTQQTASGPINVTFGVGKTEIRDIVKTWGRNKDETKVPLNVVVEVNINDKKQKQMDISATLFNPFANRMETQKQRLIQFWASTSFIYTDFVISSPDIKNAKVGDLIQSFVTCQFQR